MEINYVSGHATAFECDLLVLPVFSDGVNDANFKAVDKALGGRLSDAIGTSQFSGKLGESRVVHGDGVAARRVAVVGAGSKKTFEPSLLRHVAAFADKLANSFGAKRVAFVLPSAGRDAMHALQLAAEGFHLASYRFDKYRGADARRADCVEKVDLAISGKIDRKAVNATLSRAQHVARAVMNARDLVNEPAAAMTPSALADHARAIAKEHGLTCKVLGPKECEKLGMGMFLAVGQGSDEEARFIHLTYKPKKAVKKVIALVGKAVTFDSGGYSLKPSASMLDMKIDMAGSAAVISAMSALSALGCPYEVHGICAAAENLVSGRAYKLGDVLRSMDGATVEINNTDAEGRLTLGDAITYAREKVKPDELLDFATLTGACVVALGPYTAGVMSTDERLCKAWLAAADRAGEDMWRMPLNERLREQLKSPIADMRNTGGRMGGAITAGLFLKSFAKDTPWVHVDIAGPASAAKDWGATAEGGTGFAVATILEHLQG